MTKKAQRPRPTVDFSKDPGRVRPEFAQETDVNFLINRFARTGYLPNATREPGEYMVANSTSLHEAMNLLQQAESMFMELPAKLRKDFDNDPGKFLDFAQDPKNKEAMQDYGLLKTPPRTEKVPTSQTPSEAPQEPISDPNAKA